MAEIKQDLYGLQYSDRFSLQGIHEAEINLNLTPAPPTASSCSTTWPTGCIP